MIRSTVLAVAILSTASAFGQSAPLTDHEIVQAHATCHRSENIIYTEKGKGEAPDTTRIKTDYKSDMKAQCDAVDAEYTKRDIAARASAIDQAQRDQLNATADQLKGVKK